MTRLSRTATIVNLKGLHARASAKFVTFVSRLPEGIKVEVEKVAVINVGGKNETCR